MFETREKPETAARDLAEVPCRVVLPDWLRAEFPKRGAVLTSYEEARQYPRYFLRGYEHTAVLRCLPSLKGLHRTVDEWAVYTVTLSRGGASFLHFEQLFPGERAQFLVPEKLDRTIEVKWCRRLGPQCYEAGAQFLERLSVQEFRAMIA